MRLGNGQRKRYQHWCQVSIERNCEELTNCHPHSVPVLKDYSFLELIPGIYSMSVSLLLYYFSQRLQVAHTPSVKCSYLSDKTARKRYKAIRYKSRRWREPNQELCDKRRAVDIFQQFCFIYTKQRVLEQLLTKHEVRPIYASWSLPPAI